MFGSNTGNYKPEITPYLDTFHAVYGDATNMRCFQKIIAFNKSPLKIIKNAFYFILKAFFDRKIFKFLFWVFE